VEGNSILRSRPVCASRFSLGTVRTVYSYVENSVASNRDLGLPGDLVTGWHHQLSCTSSAADGIVWVYFNVVALEENL
jgi:hypothetical protein